MQDDTPGTSAGGDLMEDVRIVVTSLTSPWTLEQLATAVGTDPEAVRPCVDRLLEGQTIEDLGDDPRYDGDASAPTLYGPTPLDEAPEDRDVTLD